jgi:signal transduction histidine kinase
MWWDWALVGALVAAALLEGVLRPELPWRAISVAVTVGLAPTLLWRRTRPLPVVAIAFGICGLVTALSGGAGLQNYTIAYVVTLPYALFRWGSGRETAIGSLIVLGKVGVTTALGDLDLAQGFGGAALLLTTAALGVAFRYRAVARARQLDQIKMLERERLARDLHDVVAHHVSAIAIRAQAGLAASASHPDAATDALHLIEAEASRALTEMRSMVRVLRRDRPAELAPGPRISDLEQLAGRSRTGPPVDVEIAGDLDDVPPSVGTAIYRLAQESVTNARRHARHATRIEVRVTTDETSVHLRVSDDGETSTALNGGSPGYGLIGMIERAGLLGGTCEAGPDPGRGWTVTAVLPRAASSG